jgi:hypothetical protein
MNKYPKISCICPTRGRFESLRESISFFLLQDYPNKELIIFNNHPQPIVPHQKLIKHNIKVINGGDYKDKPMGLIYNDCMKCVSEDSEYISIWDDDDMYLPWHLSSQMNKLLNSDKSAVRSKFGYWQDIYDPNGHINEDESYTIISNTLEASMIVKKIKIFFNINALKGDNDYTHLHTPWVSKVQSENNFIINDEITAIFRLNYGFNYHHLGTIGPHLNNQDTGVNKILKPKKVKKLFYDFIEKINLIVENGQVISISSDSKANLLRKITQYNIEKFEHVDKYKVWQYWDKGYNNIPSFLKLCHKSIVENTFSEVVLLDDENIKQYNLPDIIWSLGPVQRSDYIRIYFLKNFGGWWFDLDSYIIGDLDENYFRHLINHDNVFPWENDSQCYIICALLGSKPFTPIITKSINNIDKFLSENLNNVGWSGIGSNGIIKSANDFADSNNGIRRGIKNGVEFFGLSNIVRFGYNNDHMNEWNFDNMPQNKLEIIVFHWSQINSELTWKLNLTGDENDLNVIINKYPNLYKLLDLYKKNYE